MPGGVPGGKARRPIGALPGWGDVPHWHTRKKSEMSWRPQITSPRLKALGLGSCSVFAVCQLSSCHFRQNHFSVQGLCTTAVVSKNFRTETHCSANTSSMEHKGLLVIRCSTPDCDWGHRVQDLSEEQLNLCYSEFRKHCIERRELQECMC
jgi:hypothetical protein